MGDEVSLATQGDTLVLSLIPSTGTMVTWIVIAVCGTLLAMWNASPQGGAPWRTRLLGAAAVVLALAGLTWQERVELDAAQGVIRHHAGVLGVGRTRVMAVPREGRVVHRAVPARGSTRRQIVLRGATGEVELCDVNNGAAGRIAAQRVAGHLGLPIEGPANEG